MVDTINLEEISLDQYENLIKTVKELEATEVEENEKHIFKYKLQGREILKQLELLATQSYKNNSSDAKVSYYQYFIMRNIASLTIINNNNTIAF